VAGILWIRNCVNGDNLKVKIGEITIQDAQVKRFIDLKLGIPLSMIRVSYRGESIPKLGRAFQEHTYLPFECDMLKTRVVVHASSHNLVKKKHEYVLREKVADVPSGYKLLYTEVGNEKAILIPERTPIDQKEKLRQLPFIRLILEKDIP
jgi:hypothetical protein